MSAEITYDELMAAWESVAPKDSEGLTSREWATALGVHLDTAKDRLRVLIEDKKVVCTGTRRMQRIDGHTYPVPVYKLVT